MTTLRASAWVAVALFGVSAACSSDDAGFGADAQQAGAASGGAAGAAAGESGAGGREPAGRGAGAAGEGGAGGHVESDGGEPAGSDTGGAGADGGAAPIGGGSTSGGTGPGPSGDLCEQGIAHLTGCGQLQGASEGEQNCDPDDLGSQCVVPCLMAKPCHELGDWPQPILDCVGGCSI